MGNPLWEPQEYSRNIMEFKDPIVGPIIFLLDSWGSLFGVPIKVPLGIMTSTLCSQCERGIRTRFLLNGISVPFYI